MEMTPPPLSRLYEQYLKDCPGKQLRLGQWFFNNYLHKMVPLQYPHNLDKLYNSTDFDAIYALLAKIYEDYQWDVR
jgi:hypothetical protein